MPDILEIPRQPNPEVVAHDRQEIALIEQEHVDATFSQIVEDLELDPGAEQDPDVQAVVSLVAECWVDTAVMSRDEASNERNWLTEVTLRAVGGKSSYVREHGLEEYYSEGNAIRTASNGRVFEEYRDSEMSQQLRQSIPEIVEEFHFKDKFPQGVVGAEGLEYVVVPDNDAILNGGGGALVDLPNGKQGIVINELNFKWGIHGNSQKSRSLIAHEVGHSLQNLSIGEGSRPLGYMFNELYAEWSGDNEGLYYDEKHTINLLAATGFDFRKDYLPRIASGELTMSDAISAMKDHFGSRNTLRLLAHAPAIYRFPGTEKPADIIQDCVQFALQNEKATTEQIDQRLAERYSPKIANIMVTNLGIRWIIPDNLYPTMVRLARQSPDFDESVLAPKPE